MHNKKLILKMTRKTRSFLFLIMPQKFLILNQDHQLHWEVCHILQKVDNHQKVDIQKMVEDFQLHPCWAYHQACQYKQLHEHGKAHQLHVALPGHDQMQLHGPRKETHDKLLLENKCV